MCASVHKCMLVQERPALKWCCCCLNLVHHNCTALTCTFAPDKKYFSWLLLTLTCVVECCLSRARHQSVETVRVSSHLQSVQLLWSLVLPGSSEPVDEVVQLTRPQQHKPCENIHITHTRLRIGSPLAILYYTILYCAVIPEKTFQCFCAQHVRRLSAPMGWWYIGRAWIFPCGGHRVSSWLTLAQQ